MNEPEFLSCKMLTTFRGRQKSHKARKLNTRIQARPGRLGKAGGHLAQLGVFRTHDLSGVLPRQQEEGAVDEHQ